MLETAKHSLTRSYQFGSIGIPVRNLQNYGFHYGFLNLRILGSVCSRTKKEKKKKSVGGPADSLRTELGCYVSSTEPELNRHAEYAVRIRRLRMRRSPRMTPGPGMVTGRVLRPPPASFLPFCPVAGPPGAR